MQTIVTFDWSGSVAGMPSDAGASRTNQGANLPFSKVYLEHVNHLFNYGMNACHDRVLVKNCIEQCFVLVDAQREAAKDKSFAVGLFKLFRRLLIKRIDANLLSFETQGSELSSLQKEALFLKFHRKLTYREVADIMDLPLEQLSGLISNAVKILLREK